MTTSSPQSKLSLPHECATGYLERAELDLEEWQAYVAAHPRSTPFHHRRWIETLIDQYGFRPFIPAVKSGDRVRAAVPFLAGRSLKGRVRMTSLPFSDCVEVLSHDDEASDQLVSYLRSEPPACHSMSIRTDRPLESPAVAEETPTDWVRHELAVDRPVQELKSQFPSSLKRNLRSAERAGLVFSRRCDTEAMEIFYRLHVKTRRQKGIPVQPRGYFRRLLEGVLQQGLGYVGVVTHEDRPVAAAVYLHFNGTVVYKYGASAADALSVRPNEWLMYQAICLASEEGNSRFDFGVSARDQEGLRRYKRKWGAVESDVYTVPLVGPAESPHHDSAAVKIAAGVIRRSPTIVCRMLGEVFYRFAG